jgi:hypothetical protein
MSTRELRKRSWTDKGRHAERVLRVLLFFVCLMMSLAVVLIVILIRVGLLFVWDTQTPFVAGAMSQSPLQDWPLC